VALWQLLDGNVLLVGVYLSAMAAITLVALVISRETRDADYTGNVS
jgi:hypothetical protein